ncbi:MAG: amidase [Acidobacteriaceae bacterium]
MAADDVSDTPFSHSPLRQLSVRVADDDDVLMGLIETAMARRNRNAGKNTYLHIEDARAQAHDLPRRFPDRSNRPLLYGLPVAVKDCFDLAGTITTVGSRYYAQANPPAEHDSWVVQRLRSAGAVIMGKTHMQELAYGITGENPWFGDCLQPRDAAQLTGGSSSGSAASVQEGSAVAAIGTDTGGSIRAPAAFCGLVGFRASVGVGSWQGGWHLAPSFDTIGWLFQDLRDGPLLAAALFGMEPVAPKITPLCIGVPSAEFMTDCEPVLLDRLHGWQQGFASRGHQVEEFATDFWQDLFPCYAALQAHEVAALHRGHYDAFEPAINDRLKWGAALSEATLAPFRAQQAAFQRRMKELLVRFHYLLVPATPVSQLVAGADQSQARPRILRYAVPISLVGFPVVTLPGGMQLVGPHNGDADLLAFASTLTL